MSKIFDLKKMDANIIASVITIMGFFGVLLINQKIIDEKILIASVIVVLIYIQVRHKINHIITNIMSLIDGSISNKLNNIEEKLDVVTSPRLAGRVLFFSLMKNVYVIYTHRTEKNELPKKCNQLEHYVSPIPLDEATFLQLLTHWILSNSTIKDFKVKCSCNLAWNGKYNHEILENMNLIIIGINDAFYYLQMNVEKQWHLAYHIDEEGIICGSNGSAHYQSEKELNGICYGMVTRIPNPFDNNLFMILITGSRREGQIALTEWFRDPKNLIEIDKLHNHGSFQVVIKANFEKIDNEFKINNIELIDNCEIYVHAKSR
jgi:hypothetical protein